MIFNLFDRSGVECARPVRPVFCVPPACPASCPRVKHPQPLLPPKSLTTAPPCLVSRGAPLRKESRHSTGMVRLYCGSGPVRFATPAPAQKIMGLSARQGLTRSANRRRFLLRRNEAGQGSAQRNKPHTLPQTSKDLGDRPLGGIRGWPPLARARRSTISPKKTGWLRGACDPNDSLPSQLHSLVAQLAEQRIVNPCVAGSNPARGAASWHCNRPRQTMG